MTTDSQCYDDDRFNIKFVSHFVDIPDEKEREEKKNKNGTKSNRKEKEGKTESKKGPDESLKSPQLQKSNRTGKDSKNKNRSSRPRKSVSSFSEQSELESSYDDTGGERRLSNSNRRASKNWRKSISSSNDKETGQSTQLNSPSNKDFDDEESGQSTITILSSSDNFNEDEWSQSTQPVSLSTDYVSSTESILTERDSEDEEEVIILYAQLRQIVRGPAVNAPDDVQLLPTYELAEVEEDKETLSASTVVAKSPPIIDPVEIERAQRIIQDEQPSAAATAAVRHGGSEEAVRYHIPAVVRSEAARQAGRAACARATTVQPYTTQSVDLDGRRSSFETPTSNAIARPWSTSAPQMTEVTEDPDSSTTESESSEEEEEDVEVDASLVVAKRSTTMYGRGASPWFAEQSPSNDQGEVPAVETATDVGGESLSHPSSLEIHWNAEKQHQQSKLTSRCHTNAARTASRIPRPNKIQIRNRTAHHVSPAASDVDLRHETAAVVVDPTERAVSMPDVNAQSFLKSPPRHQLASCLKSNGTSTSQVAIAQKRRIRFAEKVKQRTIT